MKYSELLSEFKVDALKSLCQQFELSGYSKFNKAELVNFIASTVVSKDFLNDVLMDMDDCIFAFFDGVYNKENVTADEDDAEILSQLGFVYEKDGKYHIPQDISTKYKKIRTDEFIYQRRTLEKITTLAAALTNLCGAISVDKFVELYNGENDDKLDAAKAEAVLGEYFDVKNGLILNEYFCEEFDEGCDEDDGEKTADELAALLRRQEGYKLPELSMEELLKYADEMYFESSIAADSMQRLLEKELHIDEFEAHTLCGIIIIDVRIGSNVDKTLSLISVGGYEFKSEKQIESFAKIYAQLFRVTRMWAYCGCTPDEVQAVKPVITNKVGRNDPCPCGSGKKYKKCCGK